VGLVENGKDQLGRQSITNVEVLQKVEENESILNTAQQRKLRRIEHFLRHEFLLRDIGPNRRENVG